MKGTPHREDLLDIALEQTFPASDPPCFMAAAAIVGAPIRHIGNARDCLELRKKRPSRTACAKRLPAHGNAGSRLP